MVVLPANLHLPWQKLGLTVLAAGAYAFFWINGPLQEPQPVFEFQEHMSGFAEPCASERRPATSRFGVTAEREEHPYYHVMTARQRRRGLFAVIGDAATNPGLGDDVVAVVLSGARAAAANPDSVVLKTALDMYYAEERDRGRPARAALP